MLAIWLSVTQVVISGYQPIAEQTWVQLNPEYYPMARTPPAMFAAWRGNQFPPLAQRQRQGHWQMLFPARLEPPFELFEGEAALSKAYLARLKRIDEMAYGVASGAAVAVQLPQGQSPVRESDMLVPFIAEFSMPGLMAVAQTVSPSHETDPLLAMFGRAAGYGGAYGAHQLAATPSSVTTTITLSALAAGEGRTWCHQVAEGENLWRIANQLASAQGLDTYSYLLALVAENQVLLGHTIRVNVGDELYCPRAETLAQFDALSPAERQQQFARLERGG